VDFVLCVVGSKLAKSPLKIQRKMVAFVKVSIEIGPQKHLENNFCAYATLSTYNKVR
jgi:hypothetical protein